MAPIPVCPFSPLPMPYMGLPLSLRKPSKADLQPVLDKPANKLAFWKARLMSRDGRVSYVRVVMAASVVYQLMVLDVDPWSYKRWINCVAISCGRATTRLAEVTVSLHGMRCVRRSIWGGRGLGLPNLCWMQAALRAHWIWL
jgi:hypothetical protein